FICEAVPKIEIKGLQVAAEYISCNGVLNEAFLCVGQFVDAFDVIDFVFRARLVFGISVYPQVARMSVFVPQDSTLPRRVRLEVLVEQQIFPIRLKRASIILGEMMGGQNAIEMYEIVALQLRLHIFHIGMGHDDGLE
ncbi:MAG: hypothetical protein AAF982_03740, partial [Pseudomonadota bacterium]